MGITTCGCRAMAKAEGRSTPRRTACDTSGVIWVAAPERHGSHRMEQWIGVRVHRMPSGVLVVASLTSPTLQVRVSDD